MAQDISPHCLIVGVGKGTGLACVRKFVAEGYRVSMIARHRGRLNSFAEEIPNTTPYPADIVDLDSYRATLREIATQQGLPDVVVYNASLASFATYETLDPADLERNFRANTCGLLATAQELAPAMSKRRAGAIVVTGNTGSLRGKPSYIGFSPTKASQRILAECLARELGPQGVHVAYVVIDAVIDMPFARRRREEKPDDYYAKPDDLASEIYNVAHQPKSAQSFYVELRPFGESW
ncbi:MAG: SDR family NAD(P)-dependent oxidoreductase [Alphaproteobacteria bacterium]|nr:SDR family NAD(P)-dependent oxidoreductase [Alphaproteobacteria bacterium]